MAKQTINVGSSANKGDGDPLRTAFTKINSNFTELYDRAVNTDAQTLTLNGNTLSISGGNSVSLNISPVGDLKGSVFADDSTLLVDGVNGGIPYSVLIGAPTIPSLGDITISTRTISTSTVGESITLSTPVNGAGDGGDILLVPGTGSVNNGVVKITTSGSNEWQFDNSGDLTVPNNIVFTGGNGIIQQDNEDFTIRVQDSDDDDFELSLIVDDGAGVDYSRVRLRRDNAQIGFLDTGKYWQFNDTGTMTVPGDIDGEYGSTLKIGISTQFGGGTTYIDTAVRSHVGDTELTKIRVGHETAQIFTNQGANIWTFGSNGSLTFPDGSTALTTAVLANGLDADIKGSVFADDSTVLVDGVNGVLRANVDVGEGNTWSVTSEASTWTFDYVGGLTFPNGHTIATSSAFKIQPAHGTLLKLGDPTYAWDFDISDGNLTFPDGTTTVGKTIVVPEDEDFNITLQYDLNLTGSPESFSFVASWDRIRLPTGNGTIISGPGASDNEWSLDVANKNLSFPSNDLIRYDGSVAEQGTDYGLNLYTYTKPVIVTSGQTKSWTFGTDGNLTIPGDIRSENNIDIEINLSDSTLYRWSFGEDGDFTAPGDISIDGGITGTGYLNIQAAPNGSAYVNLDNTDHSYIGAFGNLYLLTDEDNREWVFGTDGTLTTPGDITVGGDVNGPVGASTLVIKAQPNSDTYIQLNNIVDSIVKTAASLDIVTDSADTAQTWTFGTDGSITFPDTTVQTTAFTTSPTLNVLKIDNGVHEKFQTKTGATGTVTHDCSSGHIFYHTLPSANWTVNLTNLNLSLDYATTVTLVIEQGATGYYPNAVQIDGNAVGLAWQGNTTPTPSSSRIDVVTFSILYDGLYTVLGQLTGF